MNKKIVLFAIQIFIFKININSNNCCPCCRGRGSGGPTNEEKKILKEYNRIKKSEITTNAKAIEELNKNGEKIKSENEGLSKLIESINNNKNNEIADRENFRKAMQNIIHKNNESRDESSEKKESFEKITEIILSEKYKDEDEDEDKYEYKDKDKYNVDYNLKHSTDENETNTNNTNYILSDLTRFFYNIIKYLTSDITTEEFKTTSNYLSKAFGDGINDYIKNIKNYTNNDNPKMIDIILKTYFYDVEKITAKIAWYGLTEYASLIHNNSNKTTFINYEENKNIQTDDLLKRLIIFSLTNIKFKEQFGYIQKLPENILIHLFDDNIKFEIDVKKIFNRDKLRNFIENIYKDEKYNNLEKINEYNPFKIINKEIFDKIINKERSKGSRIISLNPSNNYMKILGILTNIKSSYNNRNNNILLDIKDITKNEEKSTITIKKTNNEDEEKCNNKKLLNIISSIMGISNIVSIEDNKFLNNYAFYYSNGKFYIIIPKIIETFNCENFYEMKISNIEKKIINDNNYNKDSFYTHYNNNQDILNNSQDNSINDIILNENNNLNNNKLNSDNIGKAIDKFSENIKKNILEKLLCILKHKNEIIESSGEDTKNISKEKIKEQINKNIDKLIEDENKIEKQGEPENWSLIGGNNLIVSFLKGENNELQEAKINDLLESHNKNLHNIKVDLNFIKTYLNHYNMNKNPDLNMMADFEHYYKIIKNFKENILNEEIKEYENTFYKANTTNFINAVIEKINNIEEKINELKNSNNGNNNENNNENNNNENGKDCIVF